MSTSSKRSSKSTRLRSAARSDVGRVRSHNEDAYGCFVDIGLFVVADGMGGHAAGQDASALAVEVIGQSIRTEAEEDLTPIIDRHGNSSLEGRRLVIALQDANERVRTAAQAPDREGMGCTVVALLFCRRGGPVAIAHVGDSRVYRVRQGQAELLTEDHTLVQQLLNEGRITEEEARESKHRHVVTRAIGAPDPLLPSLRLDQPEHGDHYVLSSDGLHDVVDMEEIGRIVMEVGSDLESGCGRLVELANARGGRDNATVVLIGYASGEEEGPAGTASTDD